MDAHGTDRNPGHSQRNQTKGQSDFRFLLRGWMHPIAREVRAGCGEFLSREFLGLIIPSGQQTQLDQKDEPDEFDFL